MTHLNPSALLECIDQSRLNDLDRVVYDGTIKFSRIHEFSALSLGTSDNYQLRVMGELFGRRYVCFMGNQGFVHADYMESLGDDVLVHARDTSWLDILARAERLGFHTLIPTQWANARQMNHGLYEAFAQFDIPHGACLRIAAHVKPEVFSKTIDDLAGIITELSNHHRKRRQE